MMPKSVEWILQTALVSKKIPLAKRLSSKKFVAKLQTSLAHRNRLPNTHSKTTRCFRDHAFRLKATTLRCQPSIFLIYSPSIKIRPPQQTNYTQKILVVETWTKRLGARLSIRKKEIRSVSSIPTLADSPQSPRRFCCIHRAGRPLHKSQSRCTARIS